MRHNTLRRNGASLSRLAKSSGTKLRQAIPAANAKQRTVDANAATATTMKDRKLDFHTYHPGFAEWEPPYLRRTRDEATHVFRIVAPVDGAEMGVGPYAEIATITVNSEFSAVIAERIALMMSAAPELWRTLRELAPLIEGNGIEFINEFADAIHILWAAAGEPPYPTRFTDRQEDAIAKRATQAATPSRSSHR